MSNPNRSSKQPSHSVLFYILLGVVARTRRTLFHMAQAGGYASIHHESTFTDLRPGAEFAPCLEKDGFAFTPLSHSSVRVVSWGIPDGRPKLEIPYGGIAINLPYAVPWVQVRSAHYANGPLVVQGYDDEVLVAQTTAQLATPQLQTLTLRAVQINHMRMVIEDGESLLYHIAIPRGDV